MSDIRQMALADALYVIRRMRDSDKRMLRALQPGMSLDDFAMDRMRATFSYSLFNDDLPVVIGGANLMTSGVAVAWLVATDDICKVRRPLLRFCREFTAHLFAEKIAHRIEGTVIAGEPACERFAQFFGLQFEGVKRAAGANHEDVNIYGKVAT